MWSWLTYLSIIPANSEQLAVNSVWEKHNIRKSDFLTAVSDKDIVEYSVAFETSK